MKKIFFGFAFILMNTVNLSSQNLVLNPSFELNNVTPQGFANFISDVNNWHNPTNATPDYYNVSIPGYIISDPQPHSGNAFAALVLVAGASTPTPYWREYLQGELSTPLVKDSTYCIEFYINLRNSDVFGIQNMQLYFSNVLINTSTNSSLSYSPDVTFDISAFDTITWRKLSSQYVAMGGEKYFIVGNFDSNPTEIIYYQPLYYPAAYYYIDDFSISDCTSNPTNPIKIECNTIDIPNAFSPNNDGHNDEFCLQGWNNCIKKFNIIIYDRWGEKVFESNDPSFCWDGTNTSPLLGIGSRKLMNTEVFVYSINATLNSGEKISKKGNISLIR